MFPDFATVKKLSSQGLKRMVYRRSVSGPVTARVTHKRIFEGDRTDFQFVADFPKRSSFKEFAHEFRVNNQDVIERGIDVFVEAYLEVGQSFDEQQTRMIVDDINSVADANRRIESEQAWSFDAFLKAVEQMVLSFPENGPPKIEIVHSKPGHDPKLDVQRWLEDPANKERFESLIELKRKEWERQEGLRMLID